MLASLGGERGPSQEPGPPFKSPTGDLCTCCLPGWIDVGWEVVEFGTFPGNLEQGAGVPHGDSTAAPLTCCFGIITPPMLEQVCRTETE